MRVSSPSLEIVPAPDETVRRDDATSLCSCRLLSSWQAVGSPRKSTRLTVFLLIPFFHLMIRCQDIWFHTGGGKKKKKRWFINRFSNEERGNAKNVNLMMPLTCSSICKHLRGVLYSAVLHHQFFFNNIWTPNAVDVKVTVWSKDSNFHHPKIWQFILSLLFSYTSGLQTSHLSFRKFLCPPVMISMAKEFTVSPIFVCYSKL